MFVFADQLVDFFFNIIFSYLPFTVLSMITNALLTFVAFVYSVIIRADFLPPASTDASSRVFSCTGMYSMYSISCPLQYYSNVSNEKMRKKQKKLEKLLACRCILLHTQDFPPDAHRDKIPPFSIFLMSNMCGKPT